MNKPTGLNCLRFKWIGAAAATVGFWLPISGVIAATGVCLLTGVRVRIEIPLVLVLAGAFVSAPLKSELVRTLQKVTGFYLVGVLVNESAGRYFNIPFLPANVSVPFSAVVLLMCGIGHLAGKINSAETLESTKRTTIISGWGLTIGAVIVHMVSLGLILERFYGYGHERNLSVLGNLCLYFLLFIFLWRKLEGLRFRQAMGLALGFSYFVMIFAHR